jgi:single-stranded-DNA-specific exonuclease
MAAGVELEADAVDAFRRALAAHAAAALSPDDLIPVERVDAIVPGGDLGLDLAEDIELLRPFGMGNPQPTLLVPAARFERVTGMGEDKEHSRFTLVTAGGAKSRGVAFRSPPRELAPAEEKAHDIALRLEKNRWNGIVEPRVILRALCPTEPGEIEDLGARRPFWDELRASFGAEPRPAAAPGGVVEDRRREGFAGVAGDLFSSGESVLVAVADVPRRRAGLESVVAALASGPMKVVAWAALAARPELAAGSGDPAARTSGRPGFDHLVALDPPPGGVADPLLGLVPRAHLAWGPAEAEFAIAAYRAALDVRPQLAQLYRALRDLPADAEATGLEAALRGGGRYPRPAADCARLLSVLTELTLIELDLDARTCRVSDAVESDLELSPTYRAAQAELDAVERALAGELPAAVPATVAS